MRRQLAGVRDADVGQAVRQQQAAVDAALRRGGSATCSQPRSQPSPRFVLPRAAIVREAVESAVARLAGLAFVESITTSTTSS